MARKRTVFLSSGQVLPVPTSDPQEITVTTTVIPWGQGGAAALREYFAKNSGDEVLSFVGHEGTARLLQEASGVEVPVNRGLYTPHEGDVTIGVTLSRRLEPGEEITRDKLPELVSAVVFHFYRGIKPLEK